MKIKKEQKIIFLGILVILIAIIIKMISKLLTFAVLAVGVYLIAKGLLKLNKK